MHAIAYIQATEKIARSTQQLLPPTDADAAANRGVGAGFTFYQQLVGRKLISCSVSAMVVLWLGMLHATWASNVLLIEIEIKFVTNCFQVKYARPNAILKAFVLPFALTAATHTSC